MQLLHRVAQLGPDAGAEIHALVLAAVQAKDPAPPPAFASEARPASCARPRRRTRAAPRAIGPQARC